MGKPRPSRYLIVISIAFSMAATHRAQAKSIQGVELLAKCYMQLTGLPLPLVHTWRTQVRNGSLSPVAACNSLLDKGELAANGFGGTDEESKAVLNYLYQFHRSWFDVALIDQIEGFAGTSGNFSVPGTSKVYDFTEPALALTYNLFAQSRPEYRQVLTATNGYLALREYDLSIYPNPAAPTPFQVLFRKPGSWSVTSYTSSQVVAYPKVAGGELSGIVPQNQNATVPDYWIGPPTNPATDPNTRPQRAGDQTTPGAESIGAITGFNFFQSAGGGVLGLNVFMLLNWGHEAGLKANGSLKLPRRWIKNSLSSLLCMELPALRESDVQNYVDSSDGANVAPFREGTNCLQCHATMDQLASVGRNYFVATSDFGQSKFNATTNPYPNDILSQNIYLVGRYSASVAAPYSWSPTPVSGFHKMTPRGKLFFRSVTGALVNRDLTGIQDAGEALAETDDFYQCAAKRYFEYFTGNEVPLYDRGDPRFLNLTKSLSPEAIKYRLFIEKLARDLRRDQSLRGMIKSILASDYYKESR